MSRSFSWVIGFLSALERKKTVRDARMRTLRRLESNSTQNDAELRGERAPVVQKNKSVSKRSIEKQAEECLYTPMWNLALQNYYFAHCMPPIILVFTEQ